MAKPFIWFLVFIFLVLLIQALGLWNQRFFPVFWTLFVFSFLIIFFEKPLLSIPFALLSGLFLDFHSGLAFLSFSLTLFLLCLLINFFKKFFETNNPVFFVGAFLFSVSFFYFFGRLLDMLLKISI